MKRITFALMVGISILMSSCQLELNLNLTKPSARSASAKHSELYKKLRSFGKKLSATHKFETNLVSLPTHNLDKLAPRQDYLAFARDSIINYAKKHIGIRYRSGGMSPAGFDCSGFTSYVMSYFGYKVPHASSAQALEGEAVAVEDLQKGDLIFFGNKGRNGHYRISHAAMVCSEKGQPLAFIHSARKGITIDNVNGSSWRCYYKKRFLFGKRVIKEDNTNEMIDKIVAFQYN